MKRIVVLLLCITFVYNSVWPCSAVNNSEVLYYGEETLENGILVTDTISEMNPNSRGMSRSVTREKKYYDNGTLIGEIALTVTFCYDGSMVSVVSKSISKCETYDGWSFKQSSFSSSGGTVTLTGNLNKLLVLSTNVNISLTCDKNGNYS